MTFPCSNSTSEGLDGTDDCTDTLDMTGTATSMTLSASCASSVIGMLSLVDPDANTIRTFAGRR